VDRREKLIASVIGPELDETKAKMLDTTVKLILGDMGAQYVKFGMQKVLASWYSNLTIKSALYSFGR
jgi:hypothetical protein